jgi:hypothetical protein
VVLQQVYTDFTKIGGARLGTRNDEYEDFMLMYVYYKTFLPFRQTFLHLGPQLFLGGQAKRRRCGCRAVLTGSVSQPGFGCPTAIAARTVVKNASSPRYGDCAFGAAPAGSLAVSLRKLSKTCK